MPKSTESEQTDRNTGRDALREQAYLAWWADKTRTVRGVPYHDGWDDGYEAGRVAGQDEGWLAAEEWWASDPWPEDAAGKMHERVKVIEDRIRAERTAEIVAWLREHGSPELAGGYRDAADDIEAVYRDG